MEKKATIKDAVPELCTAMDSFVYGSYHHRAKGSFQAAWFA
jgi:hypothetical protein